MDEIENIKSTTKLPGVGIKHSWIVQHFFDKKFLVYTCVGVLISTFNVIFLWVLIDLLHIKTIIAGIIATGTVFIARYVLLMVFKVV